MAKSQFLEGLSVYIPDGSTELVGEILDGYAVKLKITKERTTKHGDYRHPGKNGTHAISVNGTLNQYAFLLTLIHEVAHMHAYVKYGPKIKPHGIEWKHTFSSIAMPFLDKKVWPKDIHMALLNYFANPKASSAGDLNLVRVLRQYDTKRTLVLEDIEEGQFFTVQNKNRVFKKGAKRRSRYLCTEILSGKAYTIHGMAKITVK